MTALLEIDRLLDDLEAGLRKKLEERGVASRRSLAFVPVVSGWRMS